MTETQEGKRSPRGGLGLGFKSGILAASFGTVLLGWTMLAQAETAVPTQSATPQQQIAAVQAPVLIGQLHVAPSASIRTMAVPSMPKRPVFTRPITRTRAS